MTLFASTLLVLFASLAGSPSPEPGNLVTVKAGNFYFNAPDSISAGVTTFQLESADSGHVLLVGRLPRGHTVAEVLGAASQDRIPEWLVLLSGPVATKGKITSATMDLSPGNYVLLCYFHSGKTPHSALGMIRPLRVVRRSAQAERAIAPDITVQLVNYDFKLSRPVTPGRHVVRFVNPSNEPHEVIIIRDGKGPPDDRFAGGIGIVPPHGSVLSTIEFVPGTYEWSCYMSDKKGRDHADMGMRRRFVVSSR